MSDKIPSADEYWGSAGGKPAAKPSIPSADEYWGATPEPPAKEPDLLDKAAATLHSDPVAPRPPGQQRGRSAVKPYGAGDARAEPPPEDKPGGSVLDKPPTEAPEKDPLIDQRGSPVTPEAFDRLKAQMAGMPKASRQAQLNRKDLPAWMRSTLAKVSEQIDLDDQAAETTKLQLPNASMEARADSLVDQGMRGDVASGIGQNEALRGGISIPPAQAKPGADPGITIEEEAQAKAEGGTGQGGSIAARGAYQAGQGLKQAMHGTMAMALRAAGDEEGAKLYEAEGAKAKVRAEANNELMTMRQRAGEMGIINTGPADYLERMSVGAANSVGQMLPGMAAGAATTLATGNPLIGARVAMGLMSGQVFGQEFVNGRTEGLSPSHAAGRASIMASLEYIGERYGLIPQAMKALAGKAATVPLEELPKWAERAVMAMEAKKLFSAPVGKIVRGQLGEGIGEQITGAGQYLLDGTKLGLDQPISVAGFLENMRDTAVQTIIATGVMQAGGAGAGVVLGGARPNNADRKMRDDAADAAELERRAAAGRIEPPMGELPAIPPAAPTTPGAPAGDRALTRDDGQLDGKPGGQPLDAGALLGTPLDEEAHGAATSPTNDRPEPTPAQQEAGNYKKGHIKLDGLDISIENPQGSVRRGVDEDGKAWENTLQSHYGYIRGTDGADGDHVDTFIKPGTPDGHQGPVFVVDQRNPKTGKFDEHKVMLGFGSADEAEAAYRANYAPDWDGMGYLTGMDAPAFRDWIKTGDHKQPFSVGFKEQSSDQRDMAAPPTLAPGPAAAAGNQPVGSGTPVGRVADAGRAGPVGAGLPAPAGSSNANPPAGPVDGADQALSDTPDFETTYPRPDITRLNQGGRDSIFEGLEGPYLAGAVKGVFQESGGGMQIDAQVARALREGLANGTDPANGKPAKPERLEAMKRELQWALDSIDGTVTELGNEFGDAHAQAFKALMVPDLEQLREPPVAGNVTSEKPAPAQPREKSQAEKDADAALNDLGELLGGDKPAEPDADPARTELLDKAADILRKYQENTGDVVRVDHLQKKLRIDFNAAAEIVEDLIKRGDAVEKVPGARAGGVNMKGVNLAPWKGSEFEARIERLLADTEAANPETAQVIRNGFMLDAKQAGITEEKVAFREQWAKTQLAKKGAAGQAAAWTPETPDSVAAYDKVSATLPMPLVAAAADRLNELGPQLAAMGFGSFLDVKNGDPAPALDLARRMRDVHNSLMHLAPSRYSAAMGYKNFKQEALDRFEDFATKTLGINTRAHPGVNMANRILASGVKEKAQKAAKNISLYPKTVWGSLMLGEINRQLGGISIDLLTELSFRADAGGLKDRNGSPRIAWFNPPAGKLGKGNSGLFRQGGIGDMGELAQWMENEGYLPVGTYENDYKEAADKARDLIKEALEKKEPQTVMQIEAEAEADREAERQAWYAEQAAEQAEQAEELRRFLMGEAGITSAEMEVLEDDWLALDNPLWEQQMSTDRSVTLEALLDSFLWSEQEIADAIAEDLAVSEANEQARQARLAEIEAVFPVQEARRDGPGRPGEAAAPGEAAPGPSGGQEQVTAENVVNGRPRAADVKRDECLLLMPCSGGKLDRRAPASEIYTGPMWTTLRTKLDGQPAPEMVVLSAKHGFIPGSFQVDPYDQRLTPERADELIAELQAGKLPLYLSGFRDVQIVGGADYRRVMRELVAQAIMDGRIEPDASIRETDGAGLGLQRKQLGEYVASLPAEGAPAPNDAARGPSGKREADAIRRDIERLNVRARGVAQERMRSEFPGPQFAAELQTKRGKDRLGVLVAEERAKRKGQIDKLERELALGSPEDRKYDAHLKVLDRADNLIKKLSEAQVVAVAGLLGIEKGNRRVEMLRTLLLVRDSQQVLDAARRLRGQPNAPSIVPEGEAMPVSDDGTGGLLEAYSEDELRERVRLQDEAKAKELEERRKLEAQIAAEQRAKDRQVDAEREAKVIKERVDASVDDFQLGQEPPSAIVTPDQAVGQGSIFDAPDVSQVPAAPVETPAGDKPAADQFTPFEGKTLEQSIPMDDGTTATLRMDAAKAMRDIERRMKALADLKACLEGAS